MFALHLPVVAFFEWLSGAGDRANKLFSNWLKIVVRLPSYDNNKNSNSNNCNNNNIYSLEYSVKMQIL